LLYSFVRWVAEDAGAKGIRRLHFVARDGDTLRLIAKACRDIRETTDLMLLHGSRQSWHLAGLDIRETARQTWLTEHAERLTVRQFLERVGLTPDDVPRHDKADDLLGAEGVARMLEVLERPAVRAVLQRQVELRRHQVRRYLHQEGVSNQHRSAFVDLGWTGRMFSSLHTVFGEARDSLPPVYLFGLVRVEAVQGDYRAWLFDVESVKDVPVHRVAAALETFCLTDSGHTVGYNEDRSGLVTPVQKYGHDPAALRWGSDTLKQAIIRFTEEAGTAAALDRQTAIDLLKRFWYHPEPTEATAWGDAPYEDDQQGLLERRLARPSDWSEATRYLRDRSVPWASACWPAGARLRTPTAIRLLVQLAVKSGWITSPPEPL